MKAPLRILVVGAGCIGTLFAARLAKAGHSVGVIARGERLADIRTHGLRLQRHGRYQVEHQPVDTFERLTPDLAADFILVTVQRPQIDALLPDLIAHPCPNIVFMFNSLTPDGEWRRLLKNRLLWAFPAALAELRDGIVHYSLLPRALSFLQITTLGGHPKRHGAAIRLMKVFNRARLPSTFHDDMPAWLKTHGALMLPIMAQGLRSLPSPELTWPDAQLVARALHESFALVSHAGDAITPLNIRLVSLLPVPVLALSLVSAFRLGLTRRMLASFSLRAGAEVAQLYAELHQLAQRQQRPTPALDELCANLY